MKFKVKLKKYKDRVVVSFPIEYFEGQPKGVCVDFVALLMNFYKRVSRNPLLSPECQEWAAHNIDCYNDAQLGSKTLLGLHYHRAIIDYINSGGICPITDADNVLDVLNEFYSNKRFFKES